MSTNALPDPKGCGAQGVSQPATLTYDASQATQSTQESGVDRGPSKLPFIEGYDIIEVLGRGGMGIVYKARHLGLKRLVALKMILAGDHADAADLARFRTEAEAVARLKHPNTVQIHEIGEHDGLPYFTLELCEGGSLARKISGTPMPARRICRPMPAVWKACVRG